MSKRALRDVAVLVVRLDSDRPRPPVLEALLQEVEDGTLRLVDFLIVRRQEHGRFEFVEIDEETYGLAGLGLGVPGLVSLEDAQSLCVGIPPGTTAALILVEPTWLERFSSALTHAGADVVDVHQIEASHANAVWRSASDAEAT